jgi:hypothetical protein
MNLYFGDECKSEGGSHRRREEVNRETLGIKRDALLGKQEGWSIYRDCPD